MKTCVINLLIQFIFCIFLVNGDTMVAFMCNKPSMFLTENGWQRVEDVDCLTDPVEVLNFCRRVYPDKQVTNVVESSTKVTIGNWCQVDKPNCRHPEHTVTPFKCVVGTFHSEALLVPEHCIFDHLHDEHRCQSNAAWRQVAENACISRGTSIESSSPLSVCGVDKFEGVEFVCCPTKKEEIKKSEEKVIASSIESHSTEQKKVLEKLSSEDVSEEEEEALPTDYYNRYLHNDDSEFFNEHEFFLRAKSDLHKQHRDKTSKIMEEWNAAKKHAEEVKKKDPKAGENLSREIAQRFQKTYEALDQEQVAETRQLLLIHEERVQTSLNKKRQDVLNKYRNLLSDDTAKEEEIVKTLQHYIRVEQKVRLHDVNRYEHLADRDPMEAETVRQQIIDHLHLVDVRIQETLDLLRRVPRLEKKIRVQMEEFLKTFHDIDAGVAGILAEQVEAQLKNQPLPDDNQPLPDDNQPLLDNNQPLSDDNQPLIDDKQSLANSKEQPAADHKQSAEMQSVEEIDAKYSEEKKMDTTEQQPAKEESAESAEAKTSSKVEEASVNNMNDWHAAEPQFDHEDDVNINDEVKPVHHEVNDFNGEQMKSLKKSNSALRTSVGHGAVVGIAVGTVTVFIVLVVGLSIIRRRPYDMTVSHTVDGVAPEESHLSNMQANGYENPTYKYFEMRAGNQA